MKHSKRKSIIKAARKTARKTILKDLITELKKVSANLGSGTDKLDKVIAKGSGKLAKKIAKQIQLDEVAILAGAKSVKAEVSTEGGAKPAPKTKVEKVAQAKPVKSKAKPQPVVTAS
jgi:type III secretion system FlhB-like substrate exporter